MDRMGQRTGGDPRSGATVPGGLSPAAHQNIGRPVVLGRMALEYRLALARAPARSGAPRDPRRGATDRQCARWRRLRGRLSRGDPSGRLGRATWSFALSDPGSSPSTGPAPLVCYATPARGRRGSGVIDPAGGGGGGVELDLLDRGGRGVACDGCSRQVDLSPRSVVTPIFRKPRERATGWVICACGGADLALPRPMAGCGSSGVPDRCEAARVAASGLDVCDPQVSDAHDHGGIDRPHPGRKLGCDRLPGSGSISPSDGSRRKGV